MVGLDCSELLQSTKIQRQKKKKKKYTHEQVQPLLIEMQRGPGDLIRQIL